MLRPFERPPALRKFERAAFLSSVSNFKHEGHLATLKSSRLVQLYEAFITSPSFQPWFSHRRAQGQQSIKQLWQQARYNAKVEHMLLGKSSSEIVELYLRVSDALELEFSEENVNLQMCKRLEEHLMAINETVSLEMQTTIKQRIEQRLQQRSRRRHSTM